MRYGYGVGGAREKEIKNSITDIIAQKFSEFISPKSMYRKAQI